MRGIILGGRGLLILLEAPGVRMRVGDEDFVVYRWFGLERAFGCCKIGN